MDNETNLELGDLLEQRIRENFGPAEEDTYERQDERLKDMNKKLPSWSLEPPFGFLK